DDRDARTGADGERLARSDLAVERASVDRRLREGARVQLLHARVAERTADDAFVADAADERPRVDARERDDATLAQPARELGPHVAHHDAFALHPLRLEA